MIQKAAVMAEPMYDMMQALRDKRFDAALPRLPKLDEWLPYYRDHRSMTQGLGNAMPKLWGMDGDEAQTLLDDSRAISQYTSTHREEVTSEIRRTMKPHKLQQLFRVSFKLAVKDYKNHLHELRREMRGPVVDDGAEEFGVALERSPAVYFYTRVVIPSIVLWRTTPLRLLRQARGSKGPVIQAEAIERLVRLDPLAMHFPEVREWTNVSDGPTRQHREALALHWRTQGLNHKKISRTTFKEVIGAMIQSAAVRLGRYYDFSKGWTNVTMNATHVMSLFNAVAHDRARRVKGVYDTDLANLQSSSWSRQLSRYRRCWDQLLPELPGPKRG
jgi:hypothetical protein